VSDSDAPAAWTDPQSTEPFTEGEYQAFRKKMNQVSRRGAGNRTWLGEATFELLIVTSLMAENQDGIYPDHVVKTATRAVRRANRALHGLEGGV